MCLVLTNVEIFLFSLFEPIEMKIRSQSTCRKFTLHFYSDNSSFKKVFCGFAAAIQSKTPETNESEIKSF